MEEAVTYQEKERDLPLDPALFTRIAAGDEEAFTVFYQDMVPRMRPFIFSITRSDMLVNEVIQESFLRCWLYRDKLPGVSNPRAWLFKITANVCYALFQRSLTEKKALDKAGEQAITTHTETTELIHLNFLKAALQNGIRQLSPQRRKIYLMNREQGLSVDEIAGELGLSIQTVRNTLSASLECLRNHLARQGYTISILSILFFRL